MPSRIAAAIAVAMLVVGGAAAIDAAETQSADQFAVENESFVPDAGNYTQLNESDQDVRYDSTVRVYDENDSLMVAADDYDWRQANGTVKTLAGGDLENDSTATIKYGYARTTQQQEALAAITGNAFDVVGLLVFLMVVFAILASLRSFA